MNSHKGPEKKNEKLKGSILNESSNIFVYFLGGGQVPVENVFLICFLGGQAANPETFMQNNILDIREKLQYEIVYSLTRISSHLQKHYFKLGPVLDGMVGP